MILRFRWRVNLCRRVITHRWTERISRIPPIPLRFLEHIPYNKIQYTSNISPARRKGPVGHRYERPLHLLCVSVISNIIYKLCGARNVPDTPGDSICLNVNGNLTYIHVIGYDAAQIYCTLRSFVSSFANAFCARFKFIKMTSQSAFCSFCRLRNRTGLFWKKNNPRDGRAIGTPVSKYLNVNLNRTSRLFPISPDRLISAANVRSCTRAVRINVHYFHLFLFNRFFF